jgi:hypothetical protein
LENGELQFRVYRQMKMYNDPALNPELYNGHFAETPAAKIKKLR